MSTSLDSVCAAIANTFSKIGQHWLLLTNDIWLMWRATVDSRESVAKTTRKKMTTPISNNRCFSVCVTVFSCDRMALYS